MFDHYLSILLALPLLFAAIIGWVKPNEDAKNIHQLGVVGSLVVLLYSALPWFFGALPIYEFTAWLPSFGINYALGADGLSLTLVILTTFLFFMAVMASLTNINKRVKLYYSMLFILITAVMGVFLARDVFVFFLFYELELIPMYFLIAIWGGPNRSYASIKFVLYTLFGSIFMLAAILGVYVMTQKMGASSETLFLFDTVKANLAGVSLGAQMLMFIGFFIGFSVKLPVVPFHTWLPDAHVEAPTPVSMLLAGILLKMGAYGMLRFCFEFMPEAAYVAAPWVALLAVINIVYTAGIALVQTDLKKLIAYSSVSHMGFVLLGLAAMNAMGFNGAVFVMFAHGIVSAALFMCVGVVYNRTHTRLLADFGGLGVPMPAYFSFFLFMSMASLGLPLLISFASETMVFYGAYTSNLFNVVIHHAFFGLPLVWNMQVATAVSAIGVILGAAYLLWMIRRIFFGALPQRWAGLNDLCVSEVFVLASLSVLVLVYGFQPTLITQRFEPWVSAMATPYTHFSKTQTIVGQDVASSQVQDTQSTFTLVTVDEMSPHPVFINETE